MNCRMKQRAQERRYDLGRGKEKKRVVASRCRTQKREDRKEEGGGICYHGNSTLLMRQGRGFENVLAIGQNSDGINKEMVCIIRAYWLPRETEEEEPVLFGRL